MSASTPLIRAVKANLREAADPGKAPEMQKYMKSAMPYLGVPMPQMRSITKRVFAAHPLNSAEAWRDTILKLWRAAKFREERYAAVELSGYRKYEAYQTLDAMPMYEEMIVTGAWWDYVDSIASHRVGVILRDFPSVMKPLLRKWSVDGDIWKRRTAILAQLHFKTDTGLKLLYDCIRPSLGESEFFLRKAIGWALREYAWTDPDEIRRYVREHEEDLSPLSKREALLNLRPGGRRGNRIG